MRTVLLGDSHLDRVRRDLHRIGPDVVNAAVGGAVAADVLGQAHAVPVTGDDVVVLSIGTNDSLVPRELPLDVFTGHLDRLMAEFRPRRWVYVAPPLGSSAAYARAASAGVTRARGLVLDTPGLLEPLGDAAFTDDGIHLTGAAYAVLLPAVREAVASVGGPPRPG